MPYLALKKANSYRLKLTGPEKAAVFLLSMGEDLSFKCCFRKSNENGALRTHWIDPLFRYHMSGHNLFSFTYHVLILSGYVKYLPPRWWIVRPLSISILRHLSNTPSLTEAATTSPTNKVWSPVVYLAETLHAMCPKHSVSKAVYFLGLDGGCRIL